MLAQRLTRSVLAGFMRGRVVGGRAWAPSSKRREDMITDAMCALATVLSHAPQNLAYGWPTRSAYP